MNEVILHGLPKQFDQLAVRAALQKDVEADLTMLVNRTQEAAGTGKGWQQGVAMVRGQLKLHLEALSIPEPTLPDKLTRSHNQRMRTFYSDAIARLNAVVGEA